MRSLRSKEKMIPILLKTSCTRFRGLGTKLGVDTTSIGIDNSIVDFTRNSGSRLGFHSTIAR